MTALWQPTWKASTAYALTAVVIPTTFGGYTWRCTTAGTSGVAEPTWPDPTITPTVVDGTVTWTGDSAARQAVQAGLLSILRTFAAANPTIIRQVRTVRPLSYANVELPVFFIGDINEADAYLGQIWQRTLTITCYLVDNLGSIDESNDRANFVHDVLLDYITINFHAVSGRSIIQAASAGDFEFDESGAVYPAILFQLTLTQQEGRA